MPKPVKRPILATAMQAGLLLATLLIVGQCMWFVQQMHWHPVAIGMAGLLVACQFGAVVRRVFGCALVISMLYFLPLFLFVAIGVSEFQDAAKGIRPMPELGWGAWFALGSCGTIMVVMGLWAHQLHPLDKAFPRYVHDEEDEVYTHWTRYIHFREVYPPRLADFCGHHGIDKLTLLIFKDSRYDHPFQLMVEFQYGALPGLGFFTLEAELAELLDRSVKLQTPSMEEAHNKGRIVVVQRTLYPNGHRPRPLKPPRPLGPPLPPPRSPAGYPIDFEWLEGAPHLPAWSEKPTEPAPRPDLPSEPVAEFCHMHGIRRLLLIDPVWRRTTLADDIDLLAEFEPGRAPGLVFFGLEQELSALVDRRIDLRTPAFLSPRVRDAMLASARVLHEAQ